MRTNLSLLTLTIGLTLTAAAPADIIHVENFEGISEGDTADQAGRYTVQNGFNSRTDFFAIEGPGSNPAGAGNNGADLFDAQNQRGFGARDLDDSDNPGPPNYITLVAVDVSGYQNITLSIDAATNTSSGWETADRIDVIVDFDNDGFGDADDQVVISLTDQGDRLGDGVSTTNASGFTTFNGALSGNPAGSIAVRVQWFNHDDGSDQSTIDNITIEGDLVPEPASVALLAAGSMLLIRRR